MPPAASGASWPNCRACESERPVERHTPVLHRRVVRQLLDLRLLPVELGGDFGRTSCEGAPTTLRLLPTCLEFDGSARLDLDGRRAVTVRSSRQPAILGIRSRVRTHDL